MTKVRMMNDLIDRINNVVALMHGVDQESVLAPQREQLIALKGMIAADLLNTKGLRYALKLVETHERSYF
jgi:hypothetical protein